MIMNQKGRGNDCFQTPPYIFNQLNKIFNFELDVACTTKNCLAEKGLYHDRSIDALLSHWGGIGLFAILRLAKKRNLLKRLIMRYRAGIVLFA